MGYREYTQIALGSVLVPLAYSTIHSIPTLCIESFLNFLFCCDRDHPIR